MSKNLNFRGMLKKSTILEKSLRQALSEKDHQIGEVQSEYKKKFNAEKKRLEQNQEISKKYKEEANQKTAFILQEVIKIIKNHLINHSRV